MPFHYRDASELDSVISRCCRPVALVVGAWVSTQEPASIPDAWRWKTALISGLSKAANWPRDGFFEDLDIALSNLQGPQDLKLERVLEAIERAEPGSSSELVRSVAAGLPNGVHRYIAENLSSKGVEAVICLNFDELIQAAAPGRFATWSTGEPCATADIYHVHGRASSTVSLRHLLSRFDLRLPQHEHELVVEATQEEVVTLGWAASDPDILSALRDGSGAVHVLIAGDEPEPTTARDLRFLAERRPVIIYRGGFARLAAGGGPSFSYPDDSSFDPARRAIESVVARLPQHLARRAYVALSYEHSIGHRRYGSHETLLRKWNDVSARSSEERTLMVLSEAEYFQAVGRPGLAALRNLQLFRRNRDPFRISEAADALERTFRGLNPLGRIAGRLLHSRAMQQYRRLGEESGDQAPRWVRARYARSLLRGGRVRQAKRILDEILQEDVLDSDLWERAHCHRLRALARARVGERRWEEDLELAVQLFRFAGRTLEVGSTHRTAALCEMLQGGAGWRDRAQAKLELTGEAYAAASDHSAGALLAVQRTITRFAPRVIGTFLLMHL